MNTLIQRSSAPDKPGACLAPTLPSPAWNETTTAYPRDRAVHELFEEQVRQTPDAIALVFGAERLTYAELNGRANRLAFRLREYGVGRDTLVACCLERSFDLMVALLAVLKAGGAYVPLDSTYPAERLAMMIEDTAATVLLAHPHLLRHLPRTPARVLTLQDPELALRPDEDPEPVSGPRDLAYVMYTSGSTGKPKGVMIEHRSIVRLVRNTNFIEIGPDEVFLQLAPASFDAATLEIWAPLLNGARLALMPPQIPSLEEIGYAIRSFGVTTLWLTAGLFHRMVDERLDDLLLLRQLVAGGDVLSTAHVGRLLAKAGSLRLVNGYGPTEGTTFTCCHTISSRDADSGSIPIGRPIANTRVHLLDEALQPVRVGVAAELCAAGDGLARGYWNQPESTAEKFVPYAGDPDGRVYKTGDLARYREDGCIEFLGRIDQQIKLRGFRIEPGEIEAALARHPGVRESVVVARTQDSGDKRLAAYVVPSGSTAPAAPALREFLKERLPAYMIPSDIVTLPALPLSPNGKIDREKLPAPGAGSVLPPPPPVSQQTTATEKTLSDLWKRVLEVEHVGLEDNFFDLGGDSLLLIQIHAELTKTIAPGLSVTDLFEFTTVRELARHITGSGPNRNNAEADERARKQREAQERLRKQRAGACR